MVSAVKTIPLTSTRDLFRQDMSSPAEIQQWWVLQTRSRAEKSLARQLSRQNISFFLPLFERRRRVLRRLVCTQIPLFPGYLFLCGTEEERRKSLESNLVARCLDVADQKGISTDLARIRDLIDSGAPLAPEARLRPGMQAEIRSGPLAGHRGQVLRKGGKLKFVIEVDFLQQGASVEIDASMIQPI